MDSITIETKITKDDYRKTVYFSLLFKDTWKLPLFIFCTIMSIIMIIINLFIKQYPLKMSAAYIIFLTFLFMFIISIEMQINSILKSDKLKFEEKAIKYIINKNTIKIKEFSADKNFSISYNFESFLKGYENKKYFLLYLNTQQVFIIPKRYINSSDINLISNLLKENIKEKFIVKSK